MKFRLRVQRLAHVYATPQAPEHSGVTFEAVPTDEAPEFVPVGHNPGRRYVRASLSLDNLEPAVAGSFKQGGDYLVTVERLPGR